LAFSFLRVILSLNAPFPSSGECQRRNSKGSAAAVSAEILRSVRVADPYDDCAIQRAATQCFMTFGGQNRFEKTMIRKTACSCIPQRMSGSGEFCLTEAGIFEGKFFRGVRQNQNNQPETVSTSDPKKRVCRAVGFLRFAILRRNIRRFSRNRPQPCRIRFQMPSLTQNS